MQAFPLLPVHGAKRQPFCGAQSKFLLSRCPAFAAPPGVSPGPSVLSRVLQAQLARSRTNPDLRSIHTQMSIFSLGPSRMEELRCNLGYQSLLDTTVFLVIITAEMALLPQPPKITQVASLGSSLSQQTDRPPLYIRGRANSTPRHIKTAHQSCNRRLGPRRGFQRPLHLLHTRAVHTHCYGELSQGGLRRMSQVRLGPQGVRSLCLSDALHDTWHARTMRPSTKCHACNIISTTVVHCMADLTLHVNKMVSWQGLGAQGCNRDSSPSHAFRNQDIPYTRGRRYHRSIAYHTSGVILIISYYLNL